MHRPIAARRPLQLELLEDRSLPTVSAILSAGVLTVTGSPGTDTIVVRRAGGIIRADGTAPIPAVEVRQIVVNAGAGNDVIFLNSQDTPGQQPLGVPVAVNAGDGNDTVLGSSGTDYLFGQNGNDVLLGAAGNDTISGGNGNDMLNSGGDADYLLGDYGDDILSGDAGNDYLNGGAGVDYLIGGAGQDALSGGADTDRFLDDYARPDLAAGSAGVWRSIARRDPGETAWASSGDVRQQISETCSLLATLVSFARTSPTDLAARLRYDASANQYVVPLFVGNAWQDVAVAFDGSWTDNEPFPGPSAADGARDYWPLIYQRAYLQALGVNTSSTDASQWSLHGTRPDELLKQNWRYPAVAIQAVTGVSAIAYPTVGDADFGTILRAVRGGRIVLTNTQTLPEKRGKVDGTGLAFGHAYAVVDAGVDRSGVYIVLRNPWGVDSQPELLARLSPSARAAFAQGSENDGLVRVSWELFKQAFPTYVVG